MGGLRVACDVLCDICETPSTKSIIRIEIRQIHFCFSYFQTLVNKIVFFFRCRLQWLEKNVTACVQRQGQWCKTGNDLSRAVADGRKGPAQHNNCDTSCATRIHAVKVSFLKFALYAYVRIGVRIKEANSAVCQISS